MMHKMEDQKEQIWYLEAESVEEDEEKIWTKGFVLFVALHLLCCGFPLLVAVVLSSMFI
jgi:hypothetical protein